MLEDTKRVIKSRNRSTDNAMNKRERKKKIQSYAKQYTYKPKDGAPNSGTLNVTQLKFR